MQEATVLNMTRQSVKCQTIKKNCRSENYRWQVIAEIIDYGRADCKIESIFQDQIKCWSNVLSEIPTEKLFACYVSALRDRDEMRDAMFDERSLTAGELLVAWNKIKLETTRPAKLRVFDHLRTAAK